MDPDDAYHAVLRDLLNQPDAYPYPFGSGAVGWLQAVTDADLTTWSWPEVRDQAVALDAVFAEWKGRYLALHEVRRVLGPVPVLTAMLDATEAALRRLHVQRQRLRRFLDACPQPRSGADWN
jgi:hypothetical protein